MQGATAATILSTRRSTPPWILSIVLCAFPFVMSIRSLSEANENFQIGIDFRMTYTAARAWFRGGDSYDDATLKRVWSNSGMPHATPPGLPQTPNVYPLSIAPAMAPLAWMSYPSALAVWLTINATAAAILGYWLIAVGRERTSESHSSALNEQPFGCDSSLRSSKLPPHWLPLAAAAVFLFGFPLRYAMIVGNLALLTTLCVVFAIQYRDRRPDFAGILFGLALMKHTLCAPLALLFLMERRWQLLAGAAATQLFLMAAATLNYPGTPPLEWIAAMLSSGIDSLAPGGVNHYASLDYTALHVELSALLYRLSPVLADWRIVILGIVCAAMLAVFRNPGGVRHRRAFIELRYVVVLTFTLIAVYHRVYDAILVIVLLVGWLLRYRGMIPSGLSACLWFAAVLSMLAGSTAAGGSGDTSFATRAFVQTNTIWALLIIQLAATAAMGWMRTGNRAEPAGRRTSIAMAG